MVSGSLLLCCCFQDIVVSHIRRSLRHSYVPFRRKSQIALVESEKRQSRLQFQRHAAFSSRHNMQRKSIQVSQVVKSFIWMQSSVSMMLMQFGREIEMDVQSWIGGKPLRPNSLYCGSTGCQSPDGSTLHVINLNHQC